MLEQTVLNEMISAANQNGWKLIPASVAGNKIVSAAIAKYARGIDARQALAVYDTTLFSNGKGGFLLTAHGIYGSDFDIPEGNRTLLPLDGLMAVEDHLKSKYQHIARYADGTRIVFFSSSVYYPGLLAAMQIAIRAGSSPAKPVRSSCDTTPAKPAKPSNNPPRVQKPAPQQPVAKPAAKPAPGISKSPQDQLRDCQTAFKQGDYRTAFVGWKRLAEAKNPEACYGLALLYQNGWGVEKDPLQAARHASTALFLAPKEVWVQEMQNVVIAGAKAACAQNNHKLAYSWYEDLVDSFELPQVLMEMAAMAREGLGVEKSSEKAACNTLAAAELNYGPALDRIVPDAIGAATYWAKKGDDKRTLEWCKIAAGYNSPGAMVMAAEMIRNGEGCKADSAAAAQWMQKAATMDAKTLRPTIADVEREYIQTAQQQLGDYALAAGLSIGTGPSAARWYEVSAQTGNKDAMHALHKLYLEGRGVPRDQKKAGEWLERALQTGKRAPSPGQATKGTLDKDKAENESPARRRYKVGAKFYKQGDYKSALQWFNKAADAGDAWAMCKIASMHAKGHGVTQDTEAAAKWMEKAAEVGDKDTEVYLTSLAWEIGAGCFGEKKYEAALPHLARAANAGHKDAMCHLILMYTQGMGVDPDKDAVNRWTQKATGAGVKGIDQRIAALSMEVGVRYYKDNLYSASRPFLEMAANAGYAEAKKYIATMDRTYKELLKAFDMEEEDTTESGIDYYSKGVDYYDKGNYKLAMEWFKKAADLGYANAMCAIAGLYANGLGMRKNADSAEWWLRKAGAASDKEDTELYANAANSTGYCYSENRNYNKAYQWFYTAAECGNALAMINLAYMCVNGEGSDKDAYEAKEWLMKAVETGNEAAKEHYPNLAYGIGNCFCDECEYKLAMEWFKKAAAFEHAKAMYNIAAMYSQGKGVRRNQDMVVWWMQKAARLGHSESQRYLKRNGYRY